MAGSHPRYEGEVIDAHCHFDAAWESEAVHIAESNGLWRQVNLWNVEWPPPTFPAWIASFSRGASGNSLRFCHTPDLSEVGSQEFFSRTAEGVRAAKRCGAVGLKVWKNLGLHLRDHDGRHLQVDDSRLDVLWNTAAREDLPVFVHVGDPVAFFKPLNPSNERYRELVEHPDWWVGGPQFPSFEELISQFRRVVEGHPDTTFVGVHFGCYAENIEYVASMLECLPNYFIDTSARLGEVGRQDPRVLRAFFIRFSDRILFGSDLAMTSRLWWPEQSLYDEQLSDFFDIHWRYFETGDDSIPNPFPIQGDWCIKGLELPGEVLRELYFATAMKLLNL